MRAFGNADDLKTAICMRERSEQNKEERRKYEKIDEDIADARIPLVLIQDIEAHTGGYLFYFDDDGNKRKAAPEDFEDGVAEAILTLSASYEEFDIENVMYMAELIKVVHSSLKLGFKVDRYGVCEIHIDDLINAYQELKDSGVEFTDEEEALYRAAIEQLKNI